MIVLMSFKYISNENCICGTKLVAARVDNDFHLSDIYVTHMRPHPSAAKARLDIPPHCINAPNLHAALVGLTQWARTDDMMIWADRDAMIVFQQLWRKMNNRKMYHKNILLDEYLNVSVEQEDEKAFFLQRIHTILTHINNLEKWNYNKE